MKTFPRILTFLAVAVLAGCTVAPLETSEPQAPAESTRPAETSSPDTVLEPILESGASEFASQWAGLSFSEFLEESYLAILRRDPELVTELGLSAALGLQDSQLTDISDAYITETYALYAAVQAALHQYDRSALSPEDQLNYDIYAYYLADILAGEAFRYHDYPVTFFITGIQVQLVDFFTDIHPVTDRRTAEAYLARLVQVDTKIDQIIEGLQLREAADVVAPRFILQWSLRDIEKIAGSPAKLTPYYTSFAAKVTALDQLTPDQQADLLSQAEAEIEATVLPTYQAFAAYLRDLAKRAPTDDGIWQHPGGEDYYAYQVRHFTTTDLTPDEIHQLGLDELARIQAEMRIIFDQLGYPQNESLPQLFARVAQDGGTLYGPDIVTGYEDLIADAKIRATAVLDLQPQADVIVIPGESGGYYIGPAVDGSRPGAFYAAVSGSEPKFGMPTLAYHEAVPGHHTQIALALETELPFFRRGSHFTAYVEGWALYAEYLMAELGAYTDDPYGDLGRLQFEAFRAARLVIDTGLHDRRWTFDQAQEFMLENTGLEPGLVQFETARYIAWPGQALAYKIGMNEILRLRAHAETQLGEQYDIRTFHNAVLGSGAVPLVILEQVVGDYIANQPGS